VGIFFALALALSGGIIFELLDFMTNRSLEFGLITSNATVWVWGIFLPLIGNFLFTYAVLLALGAWAWWQRVRTKQVGVLEIYLVAAITSLVLAGREGAFENYFFEAIVMVCIFAGIALARLLRSAERAPLWVPLALLLQLVLFWNEHHPALASHLFDITRAGNEHLAPFVQRANGTVISEDMGLLVTNNKPVDYYTFQYSTLARAGKWDQHWEVENLRAGKFPLVILNQGTREDVDHFGNFTRAFVSALDYGYGVLTEDAHYVAYAPAPLAHLRGDDFDSKLELVGWSLAPLQSTTDVQVLRAGETLMLSVVWRAEQKLNARYTTFAHLENVTGGVVAQDDHEPMRGIYSTTGWAADEMVRDTYTLRLPASLPSSDYFLRVGWYDTTTQDRLGVKGGEDFVELQKWQVTGGK
jgi:hypothetical protein